MVVTLIGYRGSGKSSVAAPLAEQLGWDWIDADAELESRQHRSISDIFDRDGEPVFRELEKQLLAELLGRDKLIIAAGGGAVLSEQTRRRMRDAGPVVWLTASVDVLESRIRSDQTTVTRRPDLTGGGGRREIEELLLRRVPLYRQCAMLRIETDNAGIEEIVDSILISIGPDVRGGS